MRRFSLLVFVLTVLVGGFAGSAMAATKCEKANAKLLDAQTAAWAKYESLIAKRDAAIKKYGKDSEKAGKIPASPVPQIDFPDLEKKAAQVCEAEKIRAVEEWVEKTIQLAAVLCIDDVQDPCDQLRKLAAGIAEQIKTKKKSD